MPLADVARTNRIIDREVNALVRKTLKKRGVPVNEAQAREVAEDLFPRMQQLRRNAYRTQLVEVGRQMAERGVEVKPAKLETYTPDSVYRLVSRTAGIAPDARSVLADGLDRNNPAKRVAITAANRMDKAAIDRVASGMTGAATRHVLAASRTLVSNTAMKGEARFAKSGKRARIGYARVLTGKENCAFCTMLASRGAVYKEDTALMKKDGTRYHDNCDCIAVMMVDGMPWEGQSEADALYALWRKHTWRGGSPLTAGYQRELWKDAMKKLDTKDLQQYVPKRLQS